MTTEKPKTPRKAPAKPRAAKVKDKLAPMIAEAPSAEEAEVRRTRLKTLIALGKERGPPTCAETTDHQLADLAHADRVCGIETVELSGAQIHADPQAAEAVLLQAEVLELTELDTFIEYRVDGVTLRTENIPGKPAPDSFLRAAQLLGVAPAEAAVFEDALSGVAAGRAGNFGAVVGVDRVGQAEALRDNGADIIVTDLGELLPS